MGNMHLVEAVDAWVGNDNGCEVYIDTDSISISTEPGNRRTEAVHVTTKYVKNNQIEEFVKWAFVRWGGRWEYHNTRTGKTAYQVRDNDLAQRILNYCMGAD